MEIKNLMMNLMNLIIEKMLKKVLYFKGDFEGIENFKKFSHFLPKKDEKNK